MPDRYDYHFLLLSPDLPPAWVFQAARRYIETFQPTITSNIEHLAHPAPNQQIAVTLLAREQHIAAMREQLAEIVRAEIRVDIVAARELSLVESILNQRADQGLPFGYEEGEIA